MRLWLSGEHDPIEKASVRVRKILRVPAAVAAMSAIAEEMSMKSRLSGAEVVAHCAFAFDEDRPPQRSRLVAWFVGALSHDGLAVAD